MTNKQETPKSASESHFQVGFVTLGPVSYREVSCTWFGQVLSKRQPIDYWGFLRLFLCKYSQLPVMGGGVLAKEGSR